MKVSFKLVWKINRSSRPEVFYKNSFQRKFAKYTGKRRQWSHFLNKNFTEKNTRAQVFLGEFDEVFENRDSAEHLGTATSESRYFY